VRFASVHLDDAFHLAVFLADPAHLVFWKSLLGVVPELYDLSALAACIPRICGPQLSIVRDGCPVASPSLALPNRCRMPLTASFSEILRCISDCYPSACLICWPALPASLLSNRNHVNDIFVIGARVFHLISSCSLLPVLSAARASLASTISLTLRAAPKGSP